MAKTQIKPETVNGIEFVPVDNKLVGKIPPEILMPYHRNPRRNADTVPMLASAIRKFGMNQFIGAISGSHPAALCQPEEFEVVVGHTRRLACIDINYGPIPCILLNHLTVEEVKAYRLADNAIADHSEWDRDLAGIELNELNELGFDMDLLGFDAAELSELMNLDIDPDSISSGTGNAEPQSLSDRFLIPPFSVLDARQGYWQERKRAWLALGIQSELGRGGRE